MRSAANPRLTTLSRQTSWNRRSQKIPAPPRTPAKNRITAPCLTCDRIRLMTAPSCGWPPIWGRISRPGVLRKDHVLGIGQASLTLAQIYRAYPPWRVPRRGTGCGIQTFHLLAHADHVTATDISPRALAFARFNLLLNAPALKLDPQNLEPASAFDKALCWNPWRGSSLTLWSRTRRRHYPAPRRRKQRRPVYIP